MSSPLDATREWVQSVVVGWTLCPFAARVLAEGRVRFALSGAREPESLLVDLDRELARLLGTPVAELDTTILVHPAVLGDFTAYNDFLGLAEDLLRERGCDGVVQLASFHPDYRFADIPPDDPANWTNRSPYPMLHLLREQSVTDALSAYRGDPASIPAANVERMRREGAEVASRAVRRCREV